MQLTENIENLLHELFHYFFFAQLTNSLSKRVPVKYAFTVIQSPTGSGFLLITVRKH